MNLPISWISKYTDVRDVPIKEFCSRMTMTGSKVEGYETEQGAMHGIVAGKVLSAERHPDSDHLWVCCVDVGSEKLQIVTGAQNVKAGDVVPVALDGSEITGGKQINAGKLRGVESVGMMCSLGELGLTAHDYPDCIEDGIMQLAADVKPGTDVFALLGMDDEIVEFEITPNRPDCLSATGIAREAAATFDRPFVLPAAKPAKTSGDISSLLTVKNETPDNCLRYSAAMVKNVRVKPSPEWMRRWLRQCGVRPINNIVDITNFVMLEYNQPMHAFDYKHVAGSSIVIRQAQTGESIMTLDGVERPLTPDMMVIADESKPMAVAGVMGGEFSGIYDDTNTVVFESACFNGVNVRATARALGMRTEASARFEKGLDAENTLPALLRVLELVEQLDAGDIVGGVADIKGNMPERRKIKLRPKFINSFLGADISEQDMVKYLKKLEFEVTDELVVTPPSFRADVEGEADLAEEIARLYGYDVIPSTVMGGLAAARPTERQRFEKNVALECVASGLYETNTFTFMNPKSLDMLRLSADAPQRTAVKISNPFGDETSLMRTLTAPSALTVLATNTAARVPKCAVFEQCFVYIPHENADELPNEKRRLSLAGYGDFDFYSLKGVIDAVLSVANIADASYEAVDSIPYLHPGRAAVITVENKTVGFLGEVHPKVCESFGCSARSVFGELDMDAVFELKRDASKFRRIPRFPATTRDLAVVCGLDVPAGRLEEKIKKACGDILESISVFDVYTGKGVDDDKKSVAFNLVLRDSSRTLTDKEADGAVARSLELLKELGAKLRQ